MVIRKDVCTHWMLCTSAANSAIIRGIRRLIKPMLLASAAMDPKFTAMTTSHGCG
jgi:hypothetical protein